jgi:exodeoxyribonuclease VII small subunit
MTAKRTQSGSFEDALRRLEEIVNKLEEGEVPLDRAMDLYEEGVKLSKACTDRLKSAELRLKKLSKSAEGSFDLTEMDGEAEE